MRFIEHIIEPTKLLMAWQSMDEANRTRYIVAELTCMGEKSTFKYLKETPDFQKACEIGFEYYPAFQQTDKIYDNVLDALMYRLPPRIRADFPQYLEGLRIKPDAALSDFALLGYSGAKLPSDGFSLIHPFNDVEGPCEFLLEVAGFRHLSNTNDYSNLKIDDEVTFLKEFNSDLNEEAIQILVKGKKIGYINRGLLPTFQKWMISNRITGAWIEKLNGSPERPTLYLYVKIAPLKECIFYKLSSFLSKILKF